MAIDKNVIISVYSGKANRCMCGCSGNWSYAKGHAREFYQKENPTQVTRICNILDENADLVKFDEKARCFYAEFDGRMYAAYMDQNY